MSRPRSLISLLETGLEKPEEKKAILEKSKKQWSRMDMDESVITRVFNPFQHINLVDPDFFKASVAEFISLMDPENVYRTSSRVGLKEDSGVKRWGAQLVKYACDNLLEKNGLLNREVLTYLGWNEYAQRYIYQPKAIYNVACAFTSTLFQQITMNSQTFPFIPTDIYTAITICINRNYARWVRKEMMEQYGYEEKLAAPLGAKRLGPLKFEGKIASVLPPGTVEIEMSALSDESKEMKREEAPAFLTEGLDEDFILVHKEMPLDSFFLLNIPLTFFGTLAQRVKENLYYYSESFLWRQGGG